MLKKEERFVKSQVVSEGLCNICGKKINPEAEDFIQNLIKDKLDDGQLDESGLAISDLESIRKSFVEVFRGMYHNRVVYPKKEEIDAIKKQQQQKEEEKQS